MDWDEELPPFTWRSRFSMWTPYVRLWDSWSEDPNGLERTGAT